MVMVCTPLVMGLAELPVQTTVSSWGLIPAANVVDWEPTIQRTVIAGTALLA
jgi:hypothetical protein